MELLIILSTIAAAIAALIVGIRRVVDGAWPWAPPSLPPGYRVELQPQNEAVLYAPDGQRLTGVYYDIYGWNVTNWRIYRVAMNHYSYHRHQEWLATHDDLRRER